MRKLRAAGVLFAALLVGLCIRAPARDLSGIALPPGFRIATLAEGLGGSPVATPGPNPGPRMLAYANGTLYASIPSQGRVVALLDTGSVTVADGLDKPHGIAVEGEWLYVAEDSRVIRMRLDGTAKETLIDHLPTGGHTFKTLHIHNHSLYVSIGSSCNVCYEQDERRAAILKCDGGNCTVFARGLRNAVGFTFHNGTMYAVDNGRDWLGDDAPPDEVDIVENGKNYGWPECYGANILDTDFHRDDHVHVRAHCTEPFELPSFADIPAHSAPLGIAWYDGTSFPPRYRDKLFVTLHGSWNRVEPTGYKIVMVDPATRAIEDFATGWLRNGTVTGRPVDILATDGALYVSDDNAGKIYRITYEGG